MTSGLQIALAIISVGLLRPAAGRAAESPAPRSDVVAQAEEVIPNSWLDRKISVEQAEADHPGITDDRIKRFPEAARPFGFENARWMALKAEMRPGDALWSFASPAESWRRLAGQAGIALVRGDRIVGGMVTLRN